MVNKQKFNKLRFAAFLFLSLWLITLIGSLFLSWALKINGETYVIDGFNPYVFALSIVLLCFALIYLRDFVHEQTSEAPKNDS